MKARAHLLKKQKIGDRMPRLLGLGVREVEPAPPGPSRPDPSPGAASGIEPGSASGPQDLPGSPTVQGQDLGRSDAVAERG